MRRWSPFLTIALLGVIALIAGANSLGPDPKGTPDLIRLPVVVASIAIGLLTTALTIRAIGLLFLESHPDLPGRRVWLVGLGVGVAVALAFLAGVNAVRA